MIKIRKIIGWVFTAIAVVFILTTLWTASQGMVMMFQIVGIVVSLLIALVALGLGSVLKI